MEDVILGRNATTTIHNYKQPAGVCCIDDIIMEEKERGREMSCIHIYIYISTLTATTLTLTLTLTLTVISNNYDFISW